jgi:DNA/RNA-binding protein KIN17
MNSTNWPSLTEFVKSLGREGICRVTETDKGLFIAWVDDSPEALRRRDAIKKKERQDKGDEEREQRLIQEQIERAKAAAREAEADRSNDDKPLLADRKEGERIKLNLFGKKPASPPDESPKPESSSDSQALALPTSEVGAESNPTTDKADGQATVTKPSAPVKLAFGTGPSKPKNVFASAGKKNPLASKKSAVPEPAKKMSEAERIMKLELERKRQAEERGGGNKRQRFG